VRRVAAAGIAAFVLAMGGAPVGAQTVPADEQPLEVAGRAAEQVSFLGVVQVRWFEGTTERRESMLVQGANGSVVVRGTTAVMATKDQRLVEHQGGRWDLLWPVTREGTTRPPLTGKYTFAPQSGPAIGGRPSRMWEVRHGGVLVERLYLDVETDLLLRREQFEAGSVGPRRTVGFETLTVGGATPEPRKPESFERVAAQAVPVARLSKRVAAPNALAGSYTRLGVYRRSGVTQVVYSDGLYDLSLFEQPGRLERGRLSGGERVAVQGTTGWRSAWAGGHIVVWEAGGTVFTAVSDAPLEQVLAAVQSLPPAQASSPLLRRLRQVCRSLLQPLAG
jgi:hypothetical protein